MRIHITAHAVRHINAAISLGSAITAAAASSASALSVASGTGNPGGDPWG